MRNGFSHAVATKVLGRLPDETTMFLSSFSNPNEFKSKNNSIITINT
ncbi:hypothetical protein BC670_1230 [Flavobacterium branchiophilum]|uniref:Uncharacterized protein n=1 Tax=Flavobacterium branchiophilum TaxID=55197 RepID=A0A543G2R2_9FLAO|nr:hypothetical protein BC670_1230 [Flavobacterium branchiophilum]